VSTDRGPRSEAKPSEGRTRKDREGNSYISYFFQARA